MRRRRPRSYTSVRGDAAPSARPVDDEGDAPRTMGVSAPMTQAASPSVAAAASASLEARSPVSVMSSAGILTWRGHGVHGVRRPVAPCAPESARRAATAGEAATKREEEKPQHEHED